MTEHVYMRAAKTLPTVEEQQAMLIRAGATDVDHAGLGCAYLDPAPRRAGAPPAFEARDRAIHACRPGDLLRVATLAVLGASEQEAAAAMARVAQRGATLHSASTGKVYAFPPEVAPALEFVADLGADLKLTRTQRGRTAAEARHARTKAQQKAAWDQAEAMWTDPAFTVKQITAKTGIRPRTLYNAVDRGELPQRGAQPFTGGPKMRARNRRSA